MQVLEFLQDNWRWIVSVGLTLISVIIVLVKKKTKVVDGVLTDTFKQLPSFINKAEELFPDGQDKQTYVLAMALDYYLSNGGLGESSLITDIIASMLEAILTTPTKKVR